MPFMVQGAENINKDPTEKPKAQTRSIRPVIIEIESGITKLLFTRDLGEATIELQQTGGMVISEVVNTSIKYVSKKIFSSRYIHYICYVSNRLKINNGT